jgi:hypothetical protein
MLVTTCESASRTILSTGHLFEALQRLSRPSVRKFGFEVRRDVVIPLRSTKCLRRWPMALTGRLSEDFLRL